MILFQNAIGKAQNTLSLRDISGSGLLPVQVELDSGVSGTFRIMGRVDPSMPWREIRPATSSGFLEAVSYVPFIQLDVTAISGASATAGVRLAVSEG